MVSFLKQGLGLKARCKTFTLYQIAFALAWKSYRKLGLLFTHKNGDFGVIYVSERSCAVPISEVESHISDRRSHYKAFSHDVTAAILVFQNNKTAAMLVYQENPRGVELVENTSAHQIVPKISLGLMSTILSPQGNNEPEQQSFSANSISFFFRTTMSVKLLLKTRLDKHDFI